MHEIDKYGSYDPFAVRKGHSPKFWESVLEAIEYCVVSAFVYCAAYALFDQIA
ncbi:MAG: hypothetical protein ABJI96_15715 [Paracoccaceae bacterium]